MGLNQSVAQWRQLRLQAGHFSGGVWRDEVDRWGGSKHQVMRTLAAQLVQRRAAVRQVHAWLGAPDARQSVGTAPPAGLTEPCAGGLAPAAGHVLLWYHWRGTHDQLVLALQAGRVVGCAWQYAGE